MSPTESSECLQIQKQEEQELQHMMDKQMVYYDPPCAGPSQEKSPHTSHGTTYDSSPSVYHIITKLPP